MTQHTLQGVQRRVLAKKLKGERRVARTGPQAAGEHYLHQQSVRAATRESYRHASTEFKAWARACGLRLDLQKDRDLAMERYLHVLYFNGEGCYAARQALFGEIFSSRLNPRDPLELPRSRQALKGFVASAPDSQRDPMPWEAVLLVADWLLQRNGPHDVHAARVSVVAFDAYLRPAEALALTSSSVTVIGSPGLVSLPRVSVRIAPSAPDDGSLPPPRTKSGSYDDTVVFADPASTTQGRAWISNLVSSLKAASPPSAPVFRLTIAQWERVFGEALADLRLKGLKATPHCLRHGGASADFAAHVRDLHSVQRKGRWLAFASVKRYEKSGRLAAQFARLSAEHVRSARRLATSLPRRLAP